MLNLKFKNLDKRGVKPLLDVLRKKYKLGIEIIDAPNKIKREAGFATKRVMITFTSGQSLELRFKPDDSKGLDIYQVRLNGKVLPVRETENFEKGLAEVAKVIQSRQSRYKALKAKRADAAAAKKKAGKGDGAGTKPKAKKTVLSYKQKETALQAKIDEADADRKILAEEYKQKAAEIDSRKAKLIDLKDAIKKERGKNKTLKAQLKKMQEAEAA